MYFILFSSVFYCIVFYFILSSYFIVCVEWVLNSWPYAITYLWLVINICHYTSGSYIYSKPQVNMMNIYSTHDNKYYIVEL